jgi:hypothetical protein
MNRGTVCAHGSAAIATIAIIGASTSITITQSPYSSSPNWGKTFRRLKMVLVLSTHEH